MLATTEDDNMTASHFVQYTGHRPTTGHGGHNRWVHVSCSRPLAWRGGAERVDTIVGGALCATVWWRQDNGRDTR